ncbi:HAD-IB family hydrolase [Timonella senegalensis]|uniref:HAD family hydrolase n=1 Tax=Timonella senegalensis TaxID=1465825 RepID=UPI002FDD09C5
MSTPHNAQRSDDPKVPGNLAREGQIAAFFDLDKTIIATSSAAAFSRPFYDKGLITKTSALRSAYAHFLFMLGGANADQTERMRQQLSSLVTGWPVEQVTSIVSDTLHQYIDPFVYAEALDLIQAHRERGHAIVIVSASGAEVVNPIAAMLGADHAIATRMEIVDGKYTGQIEFYAYGEGKASAITVLAEERGYDLARSYAYSDSITDIPMLAAVGHPHSVNADKAFRKYCDEQGWDSLTFEKPVSLGQMSTPAKSALVLGSLAVAGVGVGLAIRAARLSKRRPPRG